MAHFAKLDENNIVTQVLVVNDDVLLDEEGQEQEVIGVDFLNGLFGKLNWKQCSYNGNIRGRYPGIGSEYIPENDIFSEISPYPSWVLDRNTGTYSAPVEMPEIDPETHFVYWDEETTNWVVVEISTEAE